MNRLYDHLPQNLAEEERNVVFFVQQFLNGDAAIAHMYDKKVKVDELCRTSLSSAKMLNLDQWIEYMTAFVPFRSNERYESMCIEKLATALNLKFKDANFRKFLQNEEVKSLLIFALHARHNAVAKVTHVLCDKTIGRNANLSQLSIQDSNRLHTLCNDIAGPERAAIPDNLFIDVARLSLQR